MNNNDKMPSSRNALRRLLVLGLVVIGVLIYAYGWRVTDISLTETQDQTRQESVTRALRELLSPNIFSQDRETEAVSVDIAHGCSEDGIEIEQPEAIEGSPHIVISPTCGDPGDIITVEGSGFVSDADVFLRWIPPTGQSRPLVRADIDDSGRFSTQFEVPRIRGSEGEIHQLEAEGSWPIGLPYFSDTTNTVIEKIIETIFLALMATTIAVPISAVLSFLSARNLMRQVSLPLGNVLVGFILLPVGWMIGVALLGPVAEQGLVLGERVASGLIAGVVAVAVYGVTMRVLDGMTVEFNSRAYHARQIVQSFLLLVAVVFLVGVLGGLGMWLGDQLQDGFLADLGNFVGTLGELISLIVKFIAGLGTAFFVASIGMNLTRDWLKNLHGTPSYVAGLILGGIGGGMLMVGTALVAKLAALLGLLPPIVAAVLGMQIVAMLYNRIMGTGFRDDSNTQQTARIVFMVAGAVVTFLLVFLYMDISRGVVDGRIPSSIDWNILGITIQGFIAKAALIGIVLGAVGGVMSGTRAIFPLGMTIYNVSRTILNTLRSIEPLIMGIVFVIWVGVGPFAGVLALTLHSIAALGKLYSEQTENIDPGPLEAIQATGANRLQTIIYGVVPQIVPPYIAFTMYRWDINVRMSTIIGFVGGGGIGFLLQQQINLLRYRDAGVAVLAIAIVVSVLDYASGSIRERIV